jgi:hypothetical protein
VILVPALLAIGVSFFYVAVTLTPQSTYVGGLLPTFLVRGLAIPVVSSCTTLAVMSAVPTKLSGLASGTLGMARNIGTAFGVAVQPSSPSFYGDEGTKGIWQNWCRKKSNASPSHRMDNLRKRWRFSGSSHGMRNELPISSQVALERAS